ncbi:MAG: TIGR03435 family protein [Vicinamibacterales bacterium]
MRAPAVALLFASLANVGFGQSTEPPRFDVTSVKPTPPERQNSLRFDYCQSSGRFSVAGTPVLWSIKYAYRLKDYQIAGAPTWLDEFHNAYDIEGRPSREVSNAQCRLMVQSLFVDRFKLAAHREMRESPVYLLTIARNGAKLGKGGVKLNGTTQLNGTGEPSWPDGWTMSELATYLSDFTDRPIIDRTGLQGNYGITLDFSRTTDDMERPSLFTAVQEQLGLRLNTGTALVEIFIIDHIERPDPN